MTFSTALSICWSLLLNMVSCDLHYDKDIYTLYSPALPRVDTFSDIRVIDDSITNILASLPQQVEDARFATRQATADANGLSLSYGLGVTIGTALTIAVGLDGADLSQLTPPDWFYHIGTALYGYGFGAPFVLGGPLGSPDPGCGEAELYDVLVKYPNLMDLSGTVYNGLETSSHGVDPYTLVESRHLPAVKMYDVHAMIGDLKSGLGCLLGGDGGVGLDSSVTRLGELLTERLSLTQKLMDDWESNLI